MLFLFLNPWFYRSHTQTTRKVRRVGSILNHLEIKKKRDGDEDEEPCLFEVKMFGAVLKVDHCMLFRMITGTLILLMTLGIFVIVYFDFAKSS